jgi:hypothetical protein
MDLVAAGQVGQNAFARRLRLVQDQQCGAVCVTTAALSRPRYPRALAPLRRCAFRRYRTDRQYREEWAISLARFEWLRSSHDPDTSSASKPRGG